jgi:uncharacterized membrane protein
MNVWLQTVIAIGLCLAAALYVAWRSWRALRGGKTGCGSCSTCPSSRQPSSRQLQSIDRDGPA